MISKPRRPEKIRPAAEAYAQKGKQQKITQNECRQFHWGEMHSFPWAGGVRRCARSKYFSLCQIYKCDFRNGQLTIESPFRCPICYTTGRGRHFSYTTFRSERGAHIPVLRIRLYVCVHVRMYACVQFQSVTGLVRSSMPGRLCRRRGRPRGIGIEFMSGSVRRKYRETGNRIAKPTRTPRRISEHCGSRSSLSLFRFPSSSLSLYIYLSIYLALSLGEYGCVHSPIVPLSTIRRSLYRGTWSQTISAALRWADRWRPVYRIHFEHSSHDVILVPKYRTCRVAALMDDREQ